MEHKKIGQRRLLRLVQPHIKAALIFSVAVNVLFLVTPIYMLQVYDRVLTTGSVATLLLLTLIAFFLLGVYLFADAGRRRILGRAAELLSKSLSERALGRGFTDASRTPGDTVAAVGSLTQVQQALHQGLPAVFFDLPFVPLFLAILFFIHPLIGIVGTIGAVALIALAFMTEKLTNGPLSEAQEADRKGQTELSQIVRQRSAIVSMGMSARAVSRWSALRQEGVEAQLHAGTPAVFLGSATRALRMALQITILGLGAYLAIQGLISAGAIIASSIILGRGLAPIDQAVNGWRPLMNAWRAAGEVSEWVGEEVKAEQRPATPMPRPEPQVTLEDFAVGVPGADHALLQPVDYQFPKGRIVALLGASGSGKTSLLQTLAAAWSPHDGTARLGARDIHRWSSDDRGRFIGYLPQHVELLRGTVRENICRFTDADAEDVFEAARSAGCHELILALPDGYDTVIGEGGVFLSAGQRQAIGLARAFFGHPPLLLLDEPTAHLDASLAAHFMQRFADIARQSAEERTLTAFVATHDMRLLNAADDVLVVHDRKVLIRPREAYLRQISELKRSRTPARPVGLTVDIEEKRPGNA